VTNDQAVQRIRQTAGYRLGVLNMAALAWLLSVAALLAVLGGAGLPTVAEFGTDLALVAVVVISQVVAVVATSVDARRLGINSRDPAYLSGALRWLMRDSLKAILLRGLPPK